MAKQSRSQKGAFSCQWCGHHLHPKVDTQLQSWFHAIHLFTVTRHGVNAKESQRQLGVTYKTAWRIAALIREHMIDADGDRQIRGAGTNAEIDQTLMSGVKRSEHDCGSAVKAVVVGALERGGGNLAQVAPNQCRSTLEPLVRAIVRIGGNAHTDELRSHAKLSEAGYGHARVNHGA